MTATAHALIGASIATLIPNPIAGLPIAFISHFVVDKIPHWDPMVNKENKTKDRILIETIADVLLSMLLTVIFILYFSSSNPTYVFLSAFVSQLPDWLEIPYVFFRLKISPFYQIYKIQSWLHDVWFNARLKGFWGVATQVVTVAIFLLLALRTLPSRY